MESTKNFFASNIRFLRSRKHITQEDLANKLDITRKKLHALESGQVKAPQPEDYFKYSEFFKISIDALMKVDLSRLGELKLRDLQAGSDVYMTGSNIRVLAISVNDRNEEHIEYVPIKAKAGYTAGYNDPEFIAKLPKVKLANLPRHATYRMFPSTGDSMLPIPEGSEIVTEYVANWRDLKPGTPCIVVLKAAQDLVFKLVTIQDDGKLLLSSLNPLYEPYTVEAANVLELWKYYKHLTGTLPEREQSLQSIVQMMREMQQDIKKLKKG
jgi:transcriptional regulator with XRE-family HTH domain